MIFGRKVYGVILRALSLSLRDKRSGLRMWCSSKIIMYKELVITVVMLIVLREAIYKKNSEISL